MVFENIIELVDDKKPHYRDAWGLNTVGIHRIWFDDWELDEEHTPVEICRRFIDDPDIAKYTRGELAYTIMIDAVGRRWQILELSDIGQHASVWNTPALGIGVIGDFRKRPPTRAQMIALIDLCSDLCPALGIDPMGKSSHRGLEAPSLAGHDELPRGSKDATKRCPGNLLPMDQLRWDVAAMIKATAQQRVLRDGLVL